MLVPHAGTLMGRSACTSERRAQLGPNMLFSGIPIYLRHVIFHSFNVSCCGVGGQETFPPTF